jgi:hypothetical protein
VVLAASVVNPNIYIKKPLSGGLYFCSTFSFIIVTEISIPYLNKIQPTITQHLQELQA